MKARYVPQIEVEAERKEPAPRMGAPVDLQPRVRR
jgi:hypothetical protein